MIELATGVMALLGTVVSIAWWYIKKQSKELTPDEEHEKRMDDFNDALNSGDANNLSGVWERLREEQNKDRDRSK